MAGLRNTNGILEPIDKVGEVKPGAVYRVFSEEELRSIREIVGGLKAAEKSFDFRKLRSLEASVQMTAAALLASD